MGRLRTSLFYFCPASVIFVCMKAILFFVSMVLFAYPGFTQDVSKAQGSMKASFDAVSGMISYHTSGVVSQDGIELIAMKNAALDNFIIENKPDPVILKAIQDERASLEQLRKRILIQRERLMKPLPPMEEVH
jgi:hypothetical protein